VWIIIDRMTSEAFDASFREGQGFLIDAVSSCGGYYGDYGRTVFVGEPVKAFVKHTDAISFAWNAIRERLRPGLRFSEIQAMGVESLRKGGFDTAVRFTPHSIGLFHTDCRGVGDITLQEGMI